MSRRFLAYLLLLLSLGCGYREVELSACWPYCGGTNNFEDAGQAEDLGLNLSVDWVTPHSVALHWPSSTPADLSNFRLSLGAQSWDESFDPRLGGDEARSTTILGLDPGQSYTVVLKATRGSGTIKVGEGSVTTPGVPAGRVVLFDEGEAPARTGFLLGGPPDTHAGTGALWFNANAIGNGDGPGLTGLNANGVSGNAAYLELWIEVLPGGTGIAPLTTQLSAGGQSYDCDRLLVPIQAGWHRIEAPLGAHVREGGGNLDIGASGPITALALDAAWPAGSTVIVDDLSLRF